MRNWMTWAGAGFALALVACTTEVTSGGGGSGQGGGAGLGGSTSTGSLGGGGAGGSGGGARPPDPGGPQAGDGPGAVFAVRKFFLGDTDRNGAPDKANGWKQYGYNIDGLVTTCQGSACLQVHNRCKPRDGASPAFVYPNGVDGIDNSFGRNILPIMLGILTSYSHDVNQQVSQGRSTLLFDVEALGAGDAYNPLLARLYPGAPLGHLPHFDGSDAWPVTFLSLTDPADETTTRTPFPVSYVIGNTWVSGLGDVTVPLVAGNGIDLELDLHAATVSFTMSADHATATNGTISGVLDTELFADHFREMAGGFDPSLCNGPTIDSILNQIRQASDIMMDGTPGTPADVCDGISVGLGFDAARVQLGAVAPPPTPNENCI
jgi:hypothetical protein